MYDNNDGPRLSTVIAIALGVCIGLPLVGWGVSVLVSDIYGRGEQQKEINESTNRTFQYQHFFELDGTIRTQAINVGQARKEVAEFNAKYPASATETFNISEMRSQKEANLSGLLQLCQQNVQQYNNDAQQFTRNKFLSNKLPVSFSSAACTDPANLPQSASGQ